MAMKKLFFTLISSILLSSCSLFSSNSTNSTVKPLDEEINHTYSEIKNKKLTWNYLFFDADSPYFVYCYSLTCSHCNSIKNKIIEYALKVDNFYFYEDSSLTKFSDDIDSTLGISSSENLVIKGFPTLLKIEQSKLTKNIYGEGSIFNELNI